jgi:hypothetical protein
LQDIDPARRDDARTALYRVVGTEVVALVIYEDDEGCVGSDEVNAIREWWDGARRRFDEREAYFLGDPTNPRRVVEEIEHQGPALPDAYVQMLENWTGEEFGRDSIADVLARIRAFLANHEEFEPGQRYFYSHRVPSA